MNLSRDDGFPRTNVGNVVPHNPLNFIGKPGTPRTDKCTYSPSRPVRCNVRCKVKSLQPAWSGLTWFRARPRLLLLSPLDRAAWVSKYLKGVGDGDDAPLTGSAAMALLHLNLRLEYIEKKILI